MKKGTYIVSIQLFAISLVFTALYSCINTDNTEKRNLESVRNIQSKDVEKITIRWEMLQYDNKDEIIRELNTTQDIESFVLSLRTLKAVRPNHPQFPNRWLAKIEFKNKKREKELIIIFQRTGYKDKIYVQCLGHYEFLGSAGMAISHDLHEWMKKNIGLPEMEETKGTIGGIGVTH